MGRPEDFHRRLTRVCDDSPIIPPYGQGRQVFVSRKLGVTQEAVRKWFRGEARPRTEKMHALAKLLEVDEAWLALGVEPEMDRREKRAHFERTEGGVYLAYALFTMAGGHCAFASSDDPRSEDVDFYVIIRGMQMAIHVCVARELSRGRYAFIVPKVHTEVRCIGVIPQPGFNFDLIDLKTDLVEAHKSNKGGDLEVQIDFRGGEYHTGVDTWPKITNIGEL